MIVQLVRSVSGFYWYALDRLNGRQYVESSWRETWQEARSVCESENAVLATAETEEEMSYLAERFIGATVL